MKQKNLKYDYAAVKFVIHTLYTVNNVKPLHAHKSLATMQNILWALLATFNL